MRTKTLFIVFMSLVFANLIYFIWAQDFLSPIGLSSHAHLETERLDRQLKPDHIIVGLNKASQPNTITIKDSKIKASPASDVAEIKSSEVEQSVNKASSASAGASNQTESVSSLNSSAPAKANTAINTATSTLAAELTNTATANVPTKNNSATEDTAAVLSCQQSALLSAKQVADLKPFLQKKLPANSWKISQLKVQSGWLVYMGKYPDKKDFAKKEQELKSRGVDFEVVKNPKLQPGFVLASFDTEDKANDAKKSLVHFGIRTAKVVEDDTRQPNSILVLPKTSKAFKPQIDELKNQLPSRWLGPCDKNTLR